MAAVIIHHYHGFECSIVTDVIRTTVDRTRLLRLLYVDLKHGESLQIVRQQSVSIWLILWFFDWGVLCVCSR